MKVIKNMVSPDNPDNVIGHWENIKNVFSFFLAASVLLFILAALYLCGVGLTIGFVVANKPGYDFHTGCPFDNPNCNTKMLCYEGDLALCWIVGIATAVLLPIALIILVFVIINLVCMCNDCCKSFNTARKIVDTQEKGGYVINTQSEPSQVINDNKDSDIIEIDSIKKDMDIVELDSKSDSNDTP